MQRVTFKNIHLNDYNLENLSLLRRLRKTLLATKAEVCIERAKFITKYLRDKSYDQNPTQIKYAEAVNYYLSNKTPIFFDDNLLAGTTTSKPFGAPVYPEYTGMAIWPELDTITTREKNPLKLSPADAETLNFDIFPYWMERNILEYTRKKYGNPECMRLFERLIFFIASKAGCISHTVPNYKVALEKGVEYIIEEAAEREMKIRDGSQINAEEKEQLIFYQAMQIALKGVIAYARNLYEKAYELSKIETDPTEKEKFLKLAKVCKQVPARPARTFREALNAVWLIQVAIHAENINMAMSPGRLDQVLYKFYRQDIDKGVLSVKQAMELIACLWLKLNDNTNLVPEASEEMFGGAGTVPAVTLGGIDEKGEDAVNDLTYIMLRVSELLKTRDPSLNVRYHYQKNTREYRDRIAEVIVNTQAIPAIHNDARDIAVLQNQGIELRHARDYAIIGCVELTSAGRSYDASSSIMLNLVSILELAMYNGKRPVTGNEQIGPITGEFSQFQNFSQFWEAFKKQFAWLAEKAIELNENFGNVHQEIQPTPLLSAFIEGPLQCGKDLIFGGALYNSSGATHIGFADTVDSLNAIEKAVYLDKKCTVAELINAVKADFVDHENLHAYLVHRTPKYGTQDPIALRNSKNLILFLYDFYQGHNNYRGGKYRPAYWTMTNHAGQGKFCGALPNGRKAHMPFASGITPVSQATSNLSACYKAVGQLDSNCIPGGEAFNIKFPPINNNGDLEKFAQSIEAYLRLGGMHIQFNIMSYETLIDAKNNPDKYPELLVRVSGYSAYFKDLNEAMQDEIIIRTEYNLKSKKSVSFPQQYLSKLAFIGK